MFPQPFQYMDTRCLPEMMSFFLLSWMVFGIPGLLAMAGAGYFLMRQKMRRSGILKSLNFRRQMLAIPLAALVFGMVTGYVEAWGYHYDLETKQDSSWYDIVGIPGGPGDAMANTYGGDWQDDEAWDYRSDIAILNGLFWASVAVPAVLLIRAIGGADDSEDKPKPEPEKLELAVRRA